jgi:hypothetical protein
VAKIRIVDKRNNPASPSPAAEPGGVYVFFPDYGLLAYDGTGRQRWTRPLGPFTNIYGMGASPVIVSDLVVLVCDQSVGSFIMAVDKRRGLVNGGPSGQRRRAAIRRRSSGAAPTAAIRSSFRARFC